MNVRTRRIRSGSFGVLSLCNQRNDYNESIVTVNRTYTPSSYDTDDEKINKSFNLSYSMYNSHLLSSDKKPILVIHGGPGIPSNYLKPLANKVKDRTVILYDQVGCGKSSEPSDINAYSIAFATDDLEKLISHLGLTKFHLVGHSFGGLIAFEYVKRLVVGNYPAGDQECLSLTLSSTPFSIKDAEQESNDILKKLEGKFSPSEAVSVFHNNCVCRTEKIPTVLQESYSKRGTVWQGTEIIQDYVVRAPLISKELMPPVLLIRGEYDFVSSSFAIDDWMEMFQSNNTPCQSKTLSGCSHYCMLEDIENYSKTISDFVSQMESKFC